MNGDILRSQSGPISGYHYVSAWDSTARGQGEKKADCILDAVPMLTVLYLHCQFISTQFLYYKFANLISQIGRGLVLCNYCLAESLVIQA